MRGGMSHDRRGGGGEVRFPTSKAEERTRAKTLKLICFTHSRRGPEASAKLGEAGHRREGRVQGSRHPRAGSWQGGSTGMFSSHCFSYVGEIAMNPTSWEWWAWKRRWKLEDRGAEVRRLSSGRVWKQMNYGNVVGLPGNAIKCPFEVNGHEFKARPVSMAGDFSPTSSA